MLKTKYARQLIDEVKHWSLECNRDGKEQETIQSSTTPDPGYQTGK